MLGILFYQTITTAGIDFSTKTNVHSTCCLVKEQIWDTAGQERYQSFAVMYDVTDAQSLTDFYLQLQQYHHLFQSFLLATKLMIQAIEL